MAGGLLIRKLIVFIAIICLTEANGPAQASPATNPPDEIASIMSELFRERAQFLIDLNSDSLGSYYDQGHKQGQQALRHEKNRRRYVHRWAETRNLKWVDASSEIRIRRIQVHGNWAKVYLNQSLRLSYVYLDRFLPPQSFGIGTRHSVILQKNKDRWKIVNEWYLDPLNEDPKLIPAAPSGYAPSAKGIAASRSGSRYHRARAVAYANKYAGAAWGGGNGHRYNPKYKDYTGSGGDCTNFVSQAIGDPDEGGGLRMTGEWYYRYNAGGSPSWFHTDRFKETLLRSGRARLVAKGIFPDVVRVMERNNPVPAFMPGDLIGYVLNGDVDHFSVVVGFDANGYPLVNSHTADRYRVPFDLGWDKHTEYLLIHIED